jgi:transcriptional regulator with XRE-family HTH domain
MNEKFSARLKEARGTMSQAEFCSLLGVKQGTYSTWELGKYSPPLDMLTKIARIASHTVGWLLGEESFGSRLRQGREAAGLTPGDLGKLVNRDATYILSIENDVNPPSSEGAIKLFAQACGVSVEWLRDGKLMPGHSAQSGPCQECAKKQSQIERLEKIIDKLMK